MQIKVRLDSRPIQRWARLFSKQTLFRAVRVTGPTLVALAFAGVAHAQGTMDFSGAQTLMGTFKTILAIIKKAGGWHHGLHLHIDNSPYMALVIEATDESGPCGLHAISVCHYGEQNGDAMRDPEMLFEISRWGELHPYYWRNDYVGIEQWSRFIDGTNYCYHTELHKQHEAFAKTWDKNLRQQGFADVFDPQKHRRS